jgi:predicted secreted protein
MLTVLIEINWRTVKVARVLVFGALLISEACAQSGKMVQADDSFNRGQVALHVGETLDLSLSENASTGFQWVTSPESAHKVEKVLHQRVTDAEGAAVPPGKPGVRHFRFEAIEPGTVELELHYRRPWEASKPAARTFKLHVSVQPAQEP